MYLRIQNTLTGKERREQLFADAVTLRRDASEPTADPGDEILLGSLLVSNPQLVLRCVDGEWSVEHCGLNDTLLDNEPLPRGAARPLAPGDELRVAEYALSIVVDGALRERPQAPPLDFQIVQFESEIHNLLLDRLDLRRGEHISNLSSPDTRARIEENLDQILDHYLAAIPDSLLDGIFREALYRRMNWRITSAGMSIPLSADSDDPDACAEMVDAIERRIAAVLDLSLEPRDMEGDVERLDAGFERVLEAHALDFSEGLRRYVVADFVRRDIQDLIFGFGPLQDLLRMDCISEIMVVSRDQIFVEKFGVVEDSRRAFFSDESLLSVIERIVAPIGRRIDRSSPLVDAHLPDGSRVNAVIPPIALKGPALTIRKFSATPLTMKDLVGFGAVSEQIDRFLEACVAGAKNLVVSGGTGSGKTTLLNCLSSYIPHKERVVTVEDTAELQLKQKHVVTLESRPANVEGKGEISIRDLVKNALRMRPDRIVVGECRGAETLDMLQAMNTGHDGSLTTAHANSPEDLMLRLETMVLTGTEMPVSAIRDQVKSAIDLVVQLNRFPDGSRRVTHVSEVVGIDEETKKVIVEDVFVYRFAEGQAAAEGKHVHTGYVPTFMDELLIKGITTLDALF